LALGLKQGRVGWPITNALAYYAGAPVAKKKCFPSPTSGRRRRRLWQRRRPPAAPKKVGVQEFRVVPRQRLPAADGEFALFP